MWHCRKAHVASHTVPSSKRDGDAYAFEEVVFKQKEFPYVLMCLTVYFSLHLYSYHTDGSGFICSVFKITRFQGCAQRGYVSSNWFGSRNVGKTMHIGNVLTIWDEETFKIMIRFRRIWQVWRIHFW